MFRFWRSNFASALDPWVRCAFGMISTLFELSLITYNLPVIPLESKLFAYKQTSFCGWHRMSQSQNCQNMTQVNCNIFNLKGEFDRPYDLKALPINPCIWFSHLSQGGPKKSHNILEWAQTDSMGSIADLTFNVMLFGELTILLHKVFSLWQQHKALQETRKLSRCAKVVRRASLLVLYDENKWDDFVRAPCPFSRAISPKAFSSWFWVRIFKIIPNCCISRILWLQFHAGWSASYLRGDKISQRLEVYFTRIGGGDLIRGKNL